MPELQSVEISIQVSLEGIDGRASGKDCRGVWPQDGSRDPLYSSTTLNLPSSDVPMQTFHQLVVSGIESYELIREMMIYRE